jgi:hypothetical protein
MSNELTEEVMSVTPFESLNFHGTILDTPNPLCDLFFFFNKKGVVPLPDNISAPCGIGPWKCSFER